MRHLYFSLSCYKIVSVFNFDALSFLACSLFFFPNPPLTNLNFLPAESFWMNKTENNANMCIFPCFKYKEEKNKRLLMQFTSFKKQNTAVGNTSLWAKMNFLSSLRQECSPYPLSQLWTWLGTDYLGLALGGNINMVADCYGWSQVLHTSGQCCFSDWWF